MTSRPLLTLALLAAAAAAACSPAVSTLPGKQIPGNTIPPRIPRPAGNANRESANIMYVCRGKTSTGWIAVDYIEDKSNCAESRQRYGTAVILRLQNLKVGETLEVCADEYVPKNWAEVRVIVDEARCPRGDGAAKIGGTVREIRRIS